MTQLERLRNENSILLSRSGWLREEYHKVCIKSYKIKTRLRQLEQRLQDDIHPIEFVSLIQGYPFSTKEEKDLAWGAITECCEWHNAPNKGIYKEKHKLEKEMEQYKEQINSIDVEMKSVSSKLNTIKGQIAKLKKLQ